MGKTINMSFEEKNVQEIGRILIIPDKMAPGFHLPLYMGYIPSYSNMIIGIFIRYHVSVYRTIGSLVLMCCYIQLRSVLNIPLQCSEIN